MNSDRSGWPLDKLNALRLGRRLVTEVPAARPGRRAFVNITPASDDRDRSARREGWIRHDTQRSFRLEHWEYDEQHIAGYDYDIGAERVRVAAATDEADLGQVLMAWKLTPEQFQYPWDTDDPR